MLKEISVDLFMRRAASATPIPNGSSIAALAWRSGSGPSFYVLQSEYEP